MTGPGRRALWWASPIGAVLLVLPLSLALAAGTSDQSFRLLHRTPRLLDDSSVFLFAVAGGVLLLGILAATSLAPSRPVVRWPDLQPRQLDLVETASTVCFRVTMAGYAAFAAVGVARGARPSSLLEALTSQTNFAGELEEQFAPVAGVTTLTQVGVAYVVLAGLLWTSGRRGPVLRRLTVVLVLALCRAYFLTERLALVELVVPLGVVLACARHRRGGIGTTLAPVLALPGLVLLFGAFEYSRSWVFFRSRTSAGYPEFVVDRLAGYYATAYNNGAAQLQDLGFPDRLPYYVLEAFWTAPGIAQLGLYERLAGGSATSHYGELLQQRANPEFNNPCGLCSPLIDLGVPAGLLFLFVAGLLVGACWVSFRAGRVVGMLSYPVVFLGLLELPRYLYWTQGRLVPAALALAVVAVLLHRVQGSSGPRGRPPEPRPRLVLPLPPVVVAGGPARPGRARPAQERRDPSQVVGSAASR